MIFETIIPNFTNLATAYLESLGISSLSLNLDNALSQTPFTKKTFHKNLIQIAYYIKNISHIQTIKTSYMTDIIS